MRSSLEIISVDGTTALPYGRHQQEIRSDYQRVNQYSSSHPDALSPLHDNGQGRIGQGKGTGHSGHTHWLPNCQGQIGSFNFSKKDFDEDDDEPFFEEKTHTGVKVFFLIFGLLILAAAIYLVITKYVL